ncbi:hypothetical protein MKY95_18925 [Paenibacillus sp. FSL P4-0176]|uniref:hypothetical protein n=1 Tax=Paenibacillus sp. FSL P4-0176 TaxID=2921631 RepID=UPI0030CE4947
MNKMFKDSPVEFKRCADIVFSKVDENIYQVKKDRGEHYNNAKFIGHNGVISMLNKGSHKVAILDREERRVLVSNFQVE